MTTQSLKSQRVREQMAASNRPTMRDVAEAAGVSTATVSNVLHGLRFVGPEKQKRVRDAIARLSYSPNRVAASLRSRRSHMIGVVLPDMTTSFFSAMFRRIEELAADSNYQILLADSQEDTGRELERIQALIARQADGLIVVPCIDKSPALEEIRQSGIPTVIFDRVAADSDFDSIAVNNIAAGREGTAHLLALGHRNIAFLASDPELRNIAERMQGYRSVLQESGFGDLSRVIVSGDKAIDGERAMRTVPGGVQSAVGGLHVDSHPSHGRASRHLVGGTSYPAIHLAPHVRRKCLDDCIATFPLSHQSAGGRDCSSNMVDHDRAPRWAHFASRSSGSAVLTHRARIHGKMFGCGGLIRR